MAAALGRIPSGLFIVTWRDADDAPDRGMLASWVMQGGFAPPILDINEPLPLLMQGHAVRSLPNKRPHCIR